MKPESLFGYQLMFLKLVGFDFDSNVSSVRKILMRLFVIFNLYTNLSFLVTAIHYLWFHIHDVVLITDVMGNILTNGFLFVKLCNFLWKESKFEKLVKGLKEMSGQGKSNAKFNDDQSINFLLLVSDKEFKLIKKTQMLADKVTKGYYYSCLVTLLLIIVKEIPTNISQGARKFPVNVS